MGRLRDDIIATCSKWRHRLGAVALVSEIKESTSSTTDSESHSRTVSLLEKLKAPKCSDLTRKCVVYHTILHPKAKDLVGPS